MKSSRAFVLSVVGMFVILLVLNGLAFAAELKGSWDALNSGYAITRWPWDGGEIFVGENATVRAGTTQYPTVTQVKFRWIPPEGEGDPWVEGPKNLTDSGDTWDGPLIYDAYDTQPLNVYGNWGVQALFLGPNGQLMNSTDIVKIRAISWHVVPEVPLGTIVSLLGMLGGLCAFAIVKRKKAIPRIL